MRSRDSATTKQMIDYLVTKLVGSSVLEEVLRQFELIAEQCKLANNNKLLIDTTGLDIKVSMIDRFLVGESLAIFARYDIKVAFVCRPEQIDSRKFAGLVARNR